MDVYREIYQGLGAASTAGLGFTRRAYQMLPHLETPRILDVGCGQGRATLELAKWQTSFPEIGTIREYVERLPRSGYRLVGHFALVGLSGDAEE